MPLYHLIVALLLGLALGRLTTWAADYLPPRLAGVKATAPAASISAAWLPLLHALLAGRRASAGWRWRNIAAELLMPALAALVTRQHGLGVPALVLILYLALLVHISLVDLEHSLILNKVIAPAVVVCLLLFPLTPLAQDWSIPSAYLRGLGGVAAGFGLLLVVFVASGGRGLGGGDVKLAAALGAMLGFPQVVIGLLLGFMAGGLLALALLGFKLRSRKDRIPYGPVLAASAAAVLLTGDSIFQWYVGLFVR